MSRPPTDGECDGERDGPRDDDRHDDHSERVGPRPTAVAASDGGRSDPWADVGRRLLTGKLGERRMALSEAFGHAESALYGEKTGDGRMTGDLTPEDVYAMRRALNDARHIVEEYAAPVAGIERWGPPAPDDGGTVRGGEGEGDDSTDDHPEGDDE